MSNTENPHSNQWSDEYGYNAQPEIELLAVSPEAFSINMEVFTKENWQLTGELSSLASQIVKEFDFSRFDNYLDQTPLENRKPLNQLVTEGLLPPEILSIKQTLAHLSKTYSNAIHYNQEPKETNTEDLKHKAIFLLSLEVIQDVLYCVSDEGLSAHEFEDNRPPTLDNLIDNLKTLKILYSQYFHGRMPSLALYYTLKQYDFYMDGVEAQQELLETKTENETKREARNQALYAYTKLANGFKAVIKALQS